MLEGLAEVQRALLARRIAFVIRLGSPDEVALRLARRAALVVCDQGYLRIQQEWRKRVAAGVRCRLVRVEGDVVVPAAEAAATAQVGARTLRPRIARKLDAYLAPLRRVKLQVDGRGVAARSDASLDDIPRLLKRLSLDHTVAPVAGLRGGYPEARRRLRAFIKEDLSGYVAARARPGQPRVSMLSPYLHFGQISPVEIALAVRDSAAPAADRASFLEELIVRRELAVNFVSTTPAYDDCASLPRWAQLTLKEHAADRRPVVYSYRQLASAQTHDPYWNAAMREMLVTGFMQNHMRMYWGKKVLEWSATPEQAYQNLLRLNNTYFIDGRDASSYANVGWVFGLHDRPWPERPIFGKVRYMNAAGLRRKTDIEVYVRRWGAATRAD